MVANGHPWPWQKSAWFFVGLICLLLLFQSGTDATEGWTATRLERAMAHGSLSLASRPFGPYARGPNGRYWLAQDYFVPLLTTPMVAIAEKIPHPRSWPTDDPVVYAVAAAHGAIISAMAGLLIFLLSRRLFSIEPRVAMIAALIAVFGSTLFPYSRTNYDGEISAVFLLAALFPASSKHRRQGWTVGLLLGLAIAARFSSAAAAIALAWYAVSEVSGRRQRIERSVQIILALAPFIGWLMLTNFWRTGNPFLPPSALPQFADNNALTGHFWEGFFGNLVSPGKGLVFYAPLALVGLVGITCSRQHRLWATILLALLALTVFHAKMRNWSGHWGWGPRYLIPVIPLCLIGIAPLLSSRPGRWLVGLVALPSLLVQLLAVLANWTVRISVAKTDPSGGRAFSFARSAINDHLLALTDVLRHGQCPEITVYQAARCTPDLFWLTWPKLGMGNWPYMVAAALFIFGIYGIGKAFSLNELPR